ncbi:hypothetical protein BDFB_008672, partial [Asbolus verrucosus]
MNATFKIVQPPKKTRYFGAYDDIMADKSDFCFITHFYMPHLFQDAQYSYPHEMNSLVAVIPTKVNYGRSSHFMLSIFQPSISVLFGTLLLVISTTTMLENRIDKDLFSKTLLLNFGSLLGNSFHGFNRFSYMLKFQLIIFIFGCIIFRTAFQCSLVSSFVKPNTIKQISTIAELRHSRIKIITTEPLAKMIPMEHGLYEKTFIITPEERTRRLYKLDTSSAYVIGGAFADKFIDTLKNQQKNLPFYKMQEILVPGVSTYFFQKHSPYVDKISEYLQREKHGQWIGADYTRLQLITSMMNATFKIIEPPEQTHYTGAYEDVMNDVTDFCFISHFYMTYLFQDAEYTNPHESNAIVVVLPSNEASEWNSYTIFSIFHPFIWILIVTVMIILSWITMIDQESFFETFLHYLICCLGNPFPDLNTKHLIVKLQVITFILSCIIFRTAFQCSLISFFVSPNSVEQIHTISALRNSETNIFTSISLAKMIPADYKLSDKVFIISPTERIKRLYSLDTSAAYVIIKTFANKFVETLQNRQKNPPFYIMKEPLVPGANTYIFQRHSPYLEKVNECLLKQKQYGLSLSKYVEHFEGNSTGSGVKRHEGWFGKDYELLKVVTSMMNATFRIVEPPERTNYDGAYDDIGRDKADFCFISHFQLGMIYPDAEFTYPHEKNSVALLMPKDKSNSNTLSMVYPIIWILLVVLIVIISIISMLANIITFILGSIIFRTAFYSSLISYFVRSDPIDQINTIANLQESDIKIYISIPLGNS